MVAASPLFAQSDDDRAIRDTVKSFYAALEKKDKEAIKQFWLNDSPYTAAFLEQNETLFSSEKGVFLKNLELHNSSYSDEIFRLRLSIEIREIKQNNTFQFVKQGNLWKIWRIRRSEDDLAYQIGYAETNADRTKLLADNARLSNTALCESLYGIMFGLRDAGKFDSAYGVAEIGMRLAEQTGNKKCYVNIQQRRASVTDKKGNFADATKEYFAALEAAKKIGDQQLEATIMYHLAKQLSGQGNSQLSSDFFKRSLALAEKIDYRPLIRELLNMSALGISNKTEQLGALSRLLVMVREVGNIYGEGSVTGNIAHLYSDMGDQQKAIENMEIALRKFQQVGVQYEQIEALQGLCHFNSELGRYDIALGFAEQAYQLAIKLGHNRQGSLHLKFYMNRKLGNLTEAKKNAREAVKLAEEMRPKVLSDESTQTSYLRSQSEVYQDLTLILSELNESEEALKSAELLKARVLFDIISTGKADVSKAMTSGEIEQRLKLKQAVNDANRDLNRERQREYQNKGRVTELEVRLAKVRVDYEDFQIRLFATKPELRMQRGEFKPIQLYEIAELLPDERTALLEFAVAGDRIFLYAITRSIGKVNLQIYPLTIERDALSKQVESFRAKLQNTDLDYRSDAKNLYQTLLSKANQQLKGKHSLVIVPDVFLWDMPFQALIGPDNRFLIENVSVSYAPSLTVLRELKKSKSRRSDSPRLLAFGNPELDTKVITKLEKDRGEAFTDLPLAEVEVDRLRKIYGTDQSVVFKKGRASEAAFKAAAGNFNVLHLATHGVLNNDDPMYSALILSPGTGGDDGLLEVRELMDLNLKADLAVLSACDTGRGSRIGEGLVGLSWAFAVAGVPRVVASQWKVDSKSTTDLMTDFHRSLRSSQKLNVGRALQKAMLNQLKNPGRRHPFFWAAFVAIGAD